MSTSNQHCFADAHPRLKVEGAKITKQQNGWNNGTAVVGPCVAVPSPAGTPSHVWRIRIKGCDRPSVGIVNRSFDVEKDGYVNKTNRGWGLYLADGNVGHGKPANTPYILSSSKCLKSLAAGALVEVRLNPVARTLSYSINGEDKGIAFRDLPDGEYRGAVSLFSVGSTAEVVAWPVSYKKPEVTETTETTAVCNLHKALRDATAAMTGIDALVKKQNVQAEADAVQIANLQQEIHALRQKNQQLEEQRLKCSESELKLKQELEHVKAQLAFSTSSGNKMREILKQTQANANDLAIKYKQVSDAKTDAEASLRVLREGLHTLIGTREVVSFLSTKSDTVAQIEQKFAPSAPKQVVPEVVPAPKQVVPAPKQVVPEVVPAPKQVVPAPKQVVPAPKQVISSTVEEQASWVCPPHKPYPAPLQQSIEQAYQNFVADPLCAPASVEIRINLKGHRKGAFHIFFDKQRDNTYQFFQVNDQTQASAPVFRLTA